MLLYHWYVNVPVPEAVTDNALNEPLTQTVCAAVLCAEMVVTGLTVTVTTPEVAEEHTPLVTTAL